MTRIQRIWFILLLPLCISCIWDRDTLRKEMEGKQDMVGILVGWFDRYPPSYYEFRLENVTKELKSDPSQLSLYDDAGVACDRLHRSNEAIQWMNLKKAQLDQQKNSPQWKEQHYRYLANLGTFYAHRWLQDKKTNRSPSLDDIKRAQKLIAQAIEENPEAHFGREKYQLNLLTWIVDGGLEEYEKNSRDYFDQESLIYKEFVPREYNEESLKGYLGLIELGAAWQSEVVFRIVGLHLQNQNDNHLAALAHLRAIELSKSEIDYKELYALDGSQKEIVEKYFTRARSKADLRQKLFVSYIDHKIETGHHPDTDGAFWEDWKELDFPATPFNAEAERANFELNAIFIILGILLLCIFGIIVIILFRGLKKLFLLVKPKIPAN